MTLETVPAAPVTQPDERLPWHKPEIQRLVVSLDTALGPGSVGDGETGTEVPSDLRLKKNISKIKDPLHGVLALNGVTYSYDTSKHPEMKLSHGPQMGFIAQELERVYPQVVKTKENGFKAVNYAQLVPVLVEAMKQQQSMIVDLQDQVKELRKKK